MKWTVEAPSNIAFIKYWGKLDEALQVPTNDSISMTLSECRTITEVKIGMRDEMTLNGMPVSNFESTKQARFLSLLRAKLGYVEPVVISSKNTFPEGCGIASSASGYAALTIAAVCCWSRSKSFEDLQAKGFSRLVLADLARLGSGSASRSLFGGFVQWQTGVDPSEQKAFQIFDHSYWPLADIIVVLSSEEKKVSSSEGHRLARSSPLFTDRLIEIKQRRLPAILAAFEGRNIKLLGSLIEEEAESMHNVSETSSPPVFYRNAETHQLVAWVKNFRNSNGIGVYFTIDAGPNVHLVCDIRDADIVEKSVKAAFSHANTIRDKCGSGPRIFFDEH